MKKIFYIPLILVLTAMVSCTDLDLAPQDSTTPELFFSDESAYRAFIARVYAGLAITGQSGPAGKADISSLDEGFSNYLRQYWQLQQLPTDESVIAWGDEGLLELHEQTWTSANQFVNAMYYRVFFQVSMANEFLRESTDDKLNSRGISDAVKADVVSYRAEARFLRAFSLWHGIDLFGDIPFYTEESLVGSGAPDLASRAEVFSFIENELRSIEGTLPDPGQNEYGRVDKAAVWMLQARLYLNAEVYTGTDKYSECIGACNKVISSGVYSLQETYQHLYMTDNHNSSEIIWPIPFDGQSTQTWGGMTYLVHAPIGGNMDALLYGVGGGWGGLRTTSALVDRFPDVTGEIDERAIFHTDGQTKEIDNVTIFENGYAVPKYTNISSEGVAGSDLDHPDTDYPMFRLADAYLMYAEAVLRGGSGGDMGTAVGYVNMLRERAYNNTNGNITEGDLTLEFLLDERSREMYWETTRRTDLIRFNQYTENGVWPWKGGVKDGQTTESFRSVFPFPASELLVNPKLTQKPGY